MQIETTSITGDLSGAYPDGLSLSNAIVAAALATPGAIKTGTTASNTVLLQAYDVDGAAYSTFITATANNTPSLAISAPLGGTIAIDGAVIGANSAVAGTFTTANAANVGITDTLKLDTVSQMLTATVTLAAGAANSIDATFTIKDMAGVTVTGVHKVEVYISEAATGIGLSTDTPSGNLTASTGTVLSVLTTKAHITALTDANGVLVLNLVDSGKPADLYFVFVRPFGSLVVSAASGASWGA